MSIKGLINCVFTLLLLCIGIACGGETAPETSLFEVSIQGRNMSPNEFEVIQNDTLSLNFHFDEAGMIHVHGYEIQKKIPQNKETNVTFPVSATGQFNIAFHVEMDAHGHGDHTSHSGSGEESDSKDSGEFVLGVLKVYPR